MHSGPSVGPDQSPCCIQNWIDPTHTQIWMQTMGLGSRHRWTETRILTKTRVQTWISVFCYGHRQHNKRQETTCDYNVSCHNPFN